ncbi:mechanosensitive ion channel [Altererythrobacter sp. CC-YST694]|uniref:mechanosensitive ion channel family protein n=1 Tax=Altererythrobacter sp. CC-YST694 TaxID=2755038 RepID=UPI001D02BD9E|nr:mechanosensitive ion channel domain-containing protein [Altererythrobacter sp. CC-YST694]MCB5426307.1 mechanosensitive ion channel [Altererythrobacter sp. CC-YST694]
MASPALDDPLRGAEGLKDAVVSGSGTLGEYIEWLDSYGVQVGTMHFSAWSALVVVSVIAGVIIVSRLGGKLAHWMLGKLTGLDLTQKLLAEKLVSIAIWALAILVGIDILGIDLTALTVFSGAFGLALGFGLQKTFGNLLAGIILLMDRSIKPGDVIAVSDQSGRESFGQIRKIGIRAISVITRDKKEYLIPNENLMINQVENWSYSARDVRVKAPLSVAYTTNLEQAEELMLQAARETPRVLETPEPKVLLMGFGENGIAFEIRFWIVDPEEGISSVRSDVYKRVWQLFCEAGIHIPFPQREINISNIEQLGDLVAGLKGRKGNESTPTG